MLDPNKYPPETPVTLTLNWGAVVNILGGLGEIPAKYSRPLMDEIEHQANQQAENNQIKQLPQHTGQQPPPRPPMQ